ncbi:MAG: AmmeMemoRadiSam system radical SAM enzyme [Lachnospiraceae bacterium]|nr:AmmeMemoRadiSam system radical SAM enzyme [Lachnospiraceae bacterium]
MPACDVCFRHCNIAEGETGFCGARGTRDGKVVALNYGRITSLALDPIEKKPLNRFYPGSLILSAGSYGCNLRCPFCQNEEISWGRQAMRYAVEADTLSPEELRDIAVSYRNRGNIGVAFTYNEPLIGYEYVLDTAKLVHGSGMKNVLVTNGCATHKVMEELAPYIDAMNIDLKGFSESYYKDVLSGDRQTVMDLIAQAVCSCHVELTTLIVPGENDSEEEMREISSWIAQLKDEKGNRIGSRIPLHISRFFPRFHMQDRDATDVGLIYRLKEIAEEKLEFVYTGNC